MISLLDCINTSSFYFIILIISSKNIYPAITQHPKRRIVWMSFTSDLHWFSFGGGIHACDQNQNHTTNPSRVVRVYHSSFFNSLYKWVDVMQFAKDCPVWMECRSSSVGQKPSCSLFISFFFCFLNIYHLFRTEATLHLQLFLTEEIEVEK